MLNRQTARRRGRRARVSPGLETRRRAAPAQARGQSPAADAAWTIGEDASPTPARRPPTRQRAPPPKAALPRPERPPETPSKRRNSPRRADWTPSAMFLAAREARSLSAEATPTARPLRKSDTRQRTAKRVLEQADHRAFDAPSSPPARIGRLVGKRRL